MQSKAEHLHSALPLALPFDVRKKPLLGSRRVHSMFFKAPTAPKEGPWGSLGIPGGILHPHSANLSFLGLVVSQFLARHPGRLTREESDGD